MPDFFLDWTPQAYGIWTGVLMLAGYMFKGWLETRKLSVEDRQARREGYEQQVQNLRGENRLLQRDLTELRREYDDYRNLCNVETDQLRGQVRVLQDEVTGLKRRLDSQAVALGRQIESIKENGK